VKTGLDLSVEQNFKQLQGARVALLCHPASVDGSLRHVIDLCISHGVNLVHLFGPEHGIMGEAQYMEEVEHGHDRRTGLPVTSLYGNSVESLSLHSALLDDVDVLLCDLQDVGSRYYTFAYTLAFAMRACAESKTKCVILDRPNPIGGAKVEGNLVRDAFRSFVGEYSIANRHGLTIGELAYLFRQIDGHDCQLNVVWMQNYKRHMHFEETGLPWVLPSPNMPTPLTALLYPGACLFEGTNLSEGRGTTKPFELIGAPYITDPYRFRELILSQNIHGVALRPCYFKPLYDKHAGVTCAGVQVHVTNKNDFSPLRTSLAIIWASRHFPGFDWRREPYEFVSDRLAIDLLFGSDEPRHILERGETCDAILQRFHADEATFRALRKTVMHSAYEE